MTPTKTIVNALRFCSSYECSFRCPWYGAATKCKTSLAKAAADRLELLERKLCDWCAICPEDKRDPDNCEILWPEEGRGEDPDD